MRFTALFLLAAWLLPAQTEVKKPSPRVNGEVSAVDPAAGTITIKLDGDGSATVSVTAETRFVRVPEGEKDPHKWVKIALSDVAAGDRVVARGPATGATTVLVMSKSDVARKQQQDRSEWQKRGISGKIAGLDPASKEVTISVRSPEGLKPLVLDVSPKTAFERYAPDSVKFADAKPSAWDQLQIGDEVRALGDKSADGTHFQAEEIVSGAFQTLAGTVVSTDPASNTIQITELQNKQPLTVHIKPDTLIRRIPEQMATMMAQRMHAGGGPPGGAPGGAGASAQGGRPAGQGGAAGGNAGNFDLQRLLERLPAQTLTDLKPGDELILSSSKGGEPGNITAIRLVAGVEPFLAAAPRGNSGQVNLGQWNMDMSLPAQ